MLYNFLYSLSEYSTVFNIFRYTTFRSFLCFFTAFGTCLILGPYFIRRLQDLQMGQTVRTDGPASHLKKSGTPTMGGGLILLSLLSAAILWVNLLSPMVLSVLFVTVGFGLIGFFDDSIKVTKKNARGLSAKLRLFLEFGIVSLSVSILIQGGHLTTDLFLPFLKAPVADLGWWYVPFAAVVVVGCANAVNLTDGLDGLAIVPVIIATATLGVFAYVAGHSAISEYLQIPYVAGASELTPLASALVAAGLGFLWFNSYPAQVFMGDVGSLSLGGFLGITAVLTQNEILLILLGGVFVIEALSVITQVLSFKLTGKRVFKMAPIHHHFELKGLDETKIIVRFWIISILLAVLSLSTLKLR